MSVPRPSEAKPGEWANCCGYAGPCFMLHDADPCEGPVDVIAEETVDDDWYWIHACEKHKSRYR